MITAPELLYRCHRAGVALCTDGNELMVKPMSKLTPKLKEAIQAAKPELMAVLRGDYMRAGAYLILRYANDLDRRKAKADKDRERQAYTELAWHIEKEAK